MKFNKKNKLIIVLGVIFLLFFYKVIIGFMFPIDNSKLNSKNKVLRYLKHNYGNGSFVIVDKSVDKSRDDGQCGEYDKYTWTVSSTKSGVEFEVISGYKYYGAFVCQKYNDDTYKLKVIDKYISNVDTIEMSRNEYGDITFYQQGISDDEFAEAVYNVISNLRKQHPFTDSKVSIDVCLSLNDGRTKYLQLKDIKNISYLKSKIK